MYITQVERKQADIILSILKQQIDDQRDVEFELKTYDNGREHGYVLQLYSVNDYFVIDEKATSWIAFSENRNSDSTVVYTDIGMYKGRLTDKSYETRKLFNYDDFLSCTDYIIELMKQAHKNYIDVMKQKQLQHQ